MIRHCRKRTTRSVLPAEELSFDIMKNAVFWDEQALKPPCLPTALSYRLIFSSLSFFPLPWRLRLQVPPKRRFTINPHGTTSQKTEFFVVTAVKAPNLHEELVFRHGVC
jgi:hypothetical protein